MPDSRPDSPRDTGARIAVTHRFAGSAFLLDVALDLAPDWTVLFGHSGAGKSTLLRCLAGLLPIDVGTIFVGGDYWADTARGIAVPPHQRNVGWLSQRPALFPHLTAAENVAFGVPNLPVQQRREKSDAAMEMFRCRHLAARPPSQLSGGELQRVALARTLVRDPVLLLLDEPFDGLDFPLRESIFEDLQQWQQHRNIPILFATHDVAEACKFAAHVVRLDSGRVVAQGPPGNVLLREREKLQQWLDSPQN